MKRTTKLADACRNIEFGCHQKKISPESQPDLWLAFRQGNAVHNKCVEIFREVENYKREAIRGLSSDFRFVLDRLQEVEAEFADGVDGEDKASLESEKKLLLEDLRNLKQAYDAELQMIYDEADRREKFYYGEAEDQPYLLAFGTYATSVMDAFRKGLADRRKAKNYSSPPFLAFVRRMKLTFYAQLPRGVPIYDAGKKTVSEKTLLSGHETKGVQLTWNEGCFYLHMKITRDGRWFEFPITLHNGIIPRDARIKGVRFTVEKRGQRWEPRWTLTMQSATWNERSETVTSVVGIDLNWGFDPLSGNTVIATAYGTDGKMHRLEAHPDFIKRQQKVDDLKSISDDYLNGAKEEITAFRASLPSPPDWLPSHITKWRSWEKFRKLLEVWSNNRIPGDSASFLLLKQWQEKHVHLYDSWAVRQAKRNQNHLKNEFCLFAKELGQQYDAVVFEKLPLQKKLKGEKRRHRKTKRRLAVGMLRQRVLAKIATAVTINPKNTTKTCFACKRLTGITTEKHYVCEHCGEAFDRDENAAKNILARGLVMLQTQGPLEDVAAIGDTWKTGVILAREKQVIRGKKLTPRKGTGKA
jgi:hypothetical protein